LGLPIGDMKFLLSKDFVTILGIGEYPLLRTLYLFMLLLISEGCDHSFFFFFRKSHLIGPSPILLKHVALPSTEA
jgi:hypothetical protein